MTPSLWPSSSLYTSLSRLLFLYAFPFQLPPTFYVLRPAGSPFIMSCSSFKGHSNSLFSLSLPLTLLTPGILLTSELLSALLFLSQKELLFIIIILILFFNSPGDPDDQPCLGLTGMGSVSW